MNKDHSIDHVLKIDIKNCEVEHENISKTKLWSF